MSRARGAVNIHVNGGYSYFCAGLDFYPKRGPQCKRSLECLGKHLHLVQCSVLGRRPVQLRLMPQAHNHQSQPMPTPCVQA